MEIVIPDAFDDFDEYKVWGISPYSLLLANSYQQTGSVRAEAALRRTYDIEIVRTNYEVKWETYLKFLTTICNHWFPNPIGQAAVFVDQTTATQFVAGAAYQKMSGVMRGLRQGVDAFLETEDGERVVIPTRDLKTVTDNDDIRLLRSLELIRRTSDGYVFDREILQALRTGTTYSISEAAWALSERLCNRFGVESNAVPRILLESAEISIPESPPSGAEASLPLYLNRPDLSEFVNRLFSDDLSRTLQELQSTVAVEHEKIQEALQFGVRVEDPTTVDWPITDEAASVCATASQQHRPVVVEYLVDQLNQDKFTIHAMLRDAGIAVTLKDGHLRFNEGYSSPLNELDPINNYQDWLTNRVTELEESDYALDELARRVSEGWNRNRQSLIEGMIQQLDEFRVSPTTFVFSMLDPNYLDEHQLKQYTDDSALLKDEVNQIKNWRKNQPYDAKTFNSAVSDVCHYPISSDTSDSIIRIMSPWMNFAVQDYASTFRHLIEQDVTIRLLFRLPSPNGWNNLKQNLLNRLGDTQGNLELRTYTRFKEFYDHSEIQEIRKSDENHVGETGVHAKLFIAGDSTDGSLIAGSANLMENSFFYNPEAGLHTHDPNIIETGIEYFDLIWNIAEPDHIDESVFTQKTEFNFYPKVYRP